MNDLRLASETALELERLEKLPWFESGKPCRTDVFQERDFYTEHEAVWGRWGAQGIGQLRKVMLTPPSKCEVRPVFAQEPAYYRMYQRRLPDLRTMRSQFDQFVAALKGEGVEVMHSRPTVAGACHRALRLSTDLHDPFRGTRDQCGRHHSAYGVLGLSGRS